MKEKLFLLFDRSRPVLILVALIIGVSRPTFGTDSVVRSEGIKLTTSEIGVASYYGAKYHGRQTASGEIFNMNDLTAAHPRLPFGTRVKVTNAVNNLSVIVRINDRGPFIKSRVLDLSQAAATELQMIQRGVAEVKIEIVE